MDRQAPGNGDSQGQHQKLGLFKKSLARPISSFEEETDDG
jgi:hypothetical protein